MGSRSGSLECLRTRHMDGWTDIYTGKVNLTATDCCTFQMFSLTLTSVQFTNGYNYSTLKRELETELTMNTLRYTGRRENAANNKWGRAQNLKENKMQKEKTP